MENVVKSIKLIENAFVFPHLFLVPIQEFPCAQGRLKVVQFFQLAPCLIFAHAPNL